MKRDGNCMVFAEEIFFAGICTKKLEISDVFQMTS